ncbi:hypothetical protein ABZ208_35465 [Streptomyces sp. NPDC006208]|uniref:hypothetical protein n=1 Tax=Streptomyces sp. NPDC006208 TaxID=3156734 RepID=UPI0033BEB16F
MIEHISPTLLLLAVFAVFAVLVALVFTALGHWQGRGRRHGATRPHSARVGTAQQDEAAIAQFAKFRAAFDRMDTEQRHG